VTLEQAIHERWAESDVLAALVPADRVTTGRTSAGAMPFAVIARLESRTLRRTNGADAIDRVALRIAVGHDDYDEGLEIIRRVKAAFDRTAFLLGDGDRVLDMRRIRDLVAQRDDGSWRFVTDFTVQVYLASGM